MLMVRRSVAIWLEGNHHKHSNRKGVRDRDKGVRASGPQWMQCIYIGRHTILAPSVSYAKTEGEFTITYYIVGQILIIRYRLTEYCVV